MAEKLSKDSVAESAELSSALSAIINGSEITPYTQSTTGELNGDSLSAVGTPDSATAPCFSATETVESSSVSTPDACARYQCPECGLILSSRNCLYKHKLRKHKSTAKDAKAQRHSIVCPECKTTDSRYVFIPPNIKFPVVNIVNGLCWTLKWKNRKSV